MTANLRIALFSAPALLVANPRQLHQRGLPHALVARLWQWRLPAMAVCGPPFLGMPGPCGELFAGTVSQPMPRLARTAIITPAISISFTCSAFLHSAYCGAVVVRGTGANANCSATCVRWLSSMFPRLLLLATTSRVILATRPP